jgi:uncharacterized protein YyaL (SSP411 family)
MTAQEGGFFSAEDADSEIPGSPSQEKREGAFYVWSKAEIDSALGPAAEIFDYHYGVKPNGNVSSAGDPHAEFTGKNILIALQTIAETAKHFRNIGFQPVGPTGVSPVDSFSEDGIRDLLKFCRETLLALRSKRPRPHLDDKIITAWNGLMISAYACGAQVLNDPAYLEAATRAAMFVHTQLYDEPKKILVRNYREGRSDVEGFADDYAFVIQGLLDLYEASFDVSWLRFAIELQETKDRLFLDEEQGGYFSGTGKDASILLRMKENNDSAEPAASSIAALNLLRLAQFRDEQRWRERAQKTINAFSSQISRFPSAMPQMLVALDFSLSKPRQIVVAGKRDAPETRALLAEVHRHFIPNKVIMLADNDEGQKFLEEKLEALRAMKPITGSSAAYVCENFTCKAPVTDPKALGRLLSAT